jgi:hypothetical protein
MNKLRGIYVALTALALALVVASPAEAGRRWCEIDPVFLVAGTQVNVAVSILEEHQPAVTGPTVVTLFVPVGASAVLTSTDEGYNGYGEVVTIVPASWLTATKKGVPIAVEVTVPASRSDLPVLVEAASADGKSKSTRDVANAVITVQLTVEPAS